MGKSNEHTTKQNGGIQCVEVLVSRKFTDNSHNVLWPLSVYSLENHPIKNHGLIHNAEVFHFMRYDWKRTIQRLLEDNQISYAVLRVFISERVYGDRIMEQIEEKKFYSSHHGHHDSPALMEMEEAE